VTLRNGPKPLLGHIRLYSTVSPSSLSFPSTPRCGRGSGTALREVVCWSLPPPLVLKRRDEVRRLGCLFFAGGLELAACPFLFFFPPADSENSLRCLPRESPLGRCISRATSSRHSFPFIRQVGLFPRGCRFSPLCWARADRFFFLPRGRHTSYKPFLSFLGWWSPKILLIFSLWLARKMP